MKFRGTRRGVTSWLAGEGVALCVLVVILGAGVAGCEEEASPSLAAGYTSEREERHAREHAQYRDALRSAERLAKAVPTDSLRTLYLRQMSVDSIQRGVVSREIVCEIMRQSSRYAPVIAERAQKHLEDSLLARPGMRDRWNRVQSQGTEVLTTEGCGLENVPIAAESLVRLPRVNALP
jgi:hypothetical protein